MSTVARTLRFQGTLATPTSDHCTGPRVIAWTPCANFRTAYFRSNRSAFITFVQAATKSATSLSFVSNA